MTNSRPDFSKLYSRIYNAGLATGGTVFGSTLAFHVIAAECDGWMSQRLLPEKVASLVQFGYISEDDGQVHYARTINWDTILD